MAVQEPWTITVRITTIRRYYSFNDAFMEWIPRTPELEHLIYVGYSDRVPEYFQEINAGGKSGTSPFQGTGSPHLVRKLPHPKTLPGLGRDLAGQAGQVQPEDR